MLRFLADPTDDLALVAVLRSPFFAVSDRELLIAKESFPHAPSWWSLVQNTPELQHSTEVLGELLRKRRVETPSRLLQIANRLTGYCAVIANLPGAERREADWRGFFELVVTLEQSITDLSILVRQINRLIDAEVKVPRPIVEARDAVSLMTIHGSKGLEWSVVIVPDLARESPRASKPVYFDDSLGVAFEFEGDEAITQTPALFTLLEHQHNRREMEEARRVMYVALTRARDHIILCSTEAKGGGLDLLLPGLDAVDVCFEPVQFDPTIDLLRPPADPSVFVRSIGQQIEPVSFAFSNLPILALNDYDLCPARFRFGHHEGHPGFDDEINLVERVGRLTRKAIALKIADERRLARFDPSLPGDSVREALTFAAHFQNDSAFAALRGAGIEAHARQVTLKHGGLILHGGVDAVGTDFVVVFDCSHSDLLEYHRLKLWAYAKALDKPVAHLASLRNNQIHTFDANDLAAIERHVDNLLGGLLSNQYRATPSPGVCRNCLYGGACEDRHQDGVIGSKLAETR